VFWAPANNLTAGVVEDDHPLLPCGELFEEYEVADLEVVGDGEFWLASFEDGLASHLLDTHLPLTSSGGLDDHLPRHRAVAAL
jgi:hypothetical protein